MNEEIKVQAALIDILQREMRTPWEEIRSNLENQNVEAACECFRKYFDATTSLFGEQEELRVLVRKGGPDSNG